MKTKELFKIRILAPNVRKKEIINQLQELGILHIAQSSTTIKEFLPDVGIEGIDELSLALLKLNFLNQHVEMDESTVVDTLPQLEKILPKAQEFIERHVPKVESLIEEQKSCEENLKTIEAQYKVIKNLPEKLNLIKTSKITTLVYKSSRACKIDKTLKTQVTYVGEHDKHYCAIKVPLTKIKKVEDAIKDLPLTRINIEFLEGNAKDFLAAKEAEIESYKSRLTEISRELFRKLNGKQSEIAFYYIILQNYYDQYNLSHKFVKTSNFFLLEGYCEKEEIEFVKKAVKDTTIIATAATKEAPTKLKNKWTKAFEPITELFGVPNYGSVDPTSIVALFFPFFFGFMLSDIGYSLLLLLGLIPLYMTYKSKLRDVYIIFGLSGLVGIVFGVLFGSFFGGLIPIVPVINDTFSASFNILIFSLVVGLVHLNIGGILRIYQGIIKKESKSQLFFQGSPIFLIQLAVVAGYFEQYILAGILAATLVAVLVKEKSIFGLLDITGFFGTWFSYARLLALSLATAGVALAVNIVAEKAKALGPAGIILWLLIIIGGHGFNFLLTILGCAIHAARLHYVEFFSLFFEGEGHKFKPFEVHKSIDKWRKT